MGQCPCSHTRACRGSSARRLSGSRGSWTRTSAARSGSFEAPSLYLSALRNASRAYASSLPSASTDAVPLKVNITQLMAELLLDSPSWYNIGSSVTHSTYWGLRDVDRTRPGQPPALTPNVLDVGATAESAISASGLILSRCARCYGHDPSAYVRHTMQSREAIDALMRRAVTSRWAQIPTNAHHRRRGRR
jgi:hypothetical protein